MLIHCNKVFRCLFLLYFSFILFLKNFYSSRASNDNCTKVFFPLFFYICVCAYVQYMHGYIYFLKNLDVLFCCIVYNFIFLKVCTESNLCVYHKLMNFKSSWFFMKKYLEINNFLSLIIKSLHFNFIISGFLFYFFMIKNIFFSPFVYVSLSFYHVYDVHL